MKTLVLLLASLATMQASVIGYLGGVTPSGINYDWTYNFILSGDQNFRNADWTSVVDVDGLIGASWVGGALTVGNVTLLTQFSGPGSTPPGIPDSASLLNIVITNSGGLTVWGTGSDINLGSLIVTSTYGAPSPYYGAGSSQAQKVSDLTTTYNQFALPVPGTNVPESSTIALFAIGILCLAIGRLRHS